MGAQLGNLVLQGQSRLIQAIVVERGDMVQNRGVENSVQRLGLEARFAYVSGAEVQVWSLVASASPLHHLGVDVDAGHPD